MGKLMRKPKLTPDSPTLGAATVEDSKPGYCYLQKPLAETNKHSPDVKTNRYPSLTAENQRPRSSNLTYIPSTREVDDLFAHLEQQVQQQQILSTDKYNFDFINEIPLPGPYEWEKVNP